MSKRLNLREFQQNLIDRLQATDLAESRVSTLGVTIAGKNWLVDMMDLGEILPLPSLTPVSFTKPWFLGVINVRGNLYGVVDVAAYSHSGKASGDSQNRIMLLSKKHALNTGLLVDRILGLRDVRQWKKELGAGGQLEYQDDQGESWYQLDISGLLEQVEFLQIGSSFSH